MRRVRPRTGCAFAHSDAQPVEAHLLLRRAARSVPLSTISPVRIEPQQGIHYFVPGAGGQLRRLFFNAVLRVR